MTAPALDWRRFADPERHEGNRFIWRTTLEGGYLVTVSEMGHDDWGWMLTEPVTGFPCRMRYGMKDADAAKLSAEFYVKENK